MPELILDEQGRLDVTMFYDPWPKQAEWHRYARQKKPITNLLTIGGNGSGKSMSLMMEGFFVACEFAGSNILLIRRDYPELEKGLILDFKNTIPKELYHWNDQKHIATMFNDSKIFFGHLQNGSERTLSQYLSAAFVFIGFDELGQFSYEAWSFLKSRNRVNQGCKPNAEGKMPVCRMGGATNPLGPGYGWIKKTWVEKQPVSQLGHLIKHEGKWYSPFSSGQLSLTAEQLQERTKEIDGERYILQFDPADYVFVHSTVLDNPAQLQKDPNYLNKLMALPPVLRQKALYGDLNAVSGQYFANFTYERNVLSLPRDQERIRLDSWQPIWLGIDWGLAHCTAVYWCTRAQIKGIDGTWRNGVFTFRERVFNEQDYQATRHLHPEGWDYKKFLCETIDEAMERRTPETKSPVGTLERERLKHIFMSPDRFKRSGDVEHTIAHELNKSLRDMNLPFCTEANDERIDGALLMYNMIDAGEWVILDTCPELITALETRIHDDRKSGARLDDVLKTSDRLDDVYEAARYALVSMLRPKKKPLELQLRETIAAIPDHTARMLFAYEHRDDLEKSVQPIKPRYRIGG